MEKLPVHLRVRILPAHLSDRSHVARAVEEAGKALGDGEVAQGNDRVGQTRATVSQDDLPRYSAVLRGNVDTKMQEKAIAFPTDARTDAGSRCDGANAPFFSNAPAAVGT
jgi:hypothetical protein